MRFVTLFDPYTNFTKKLKNLFTRTLVDLVSIVFCFQINKRRRKMTYSEVREMYSMDALEYIEKREKARKRVYSSISLFFSWLLPWTLSVALLILGINMLNAKSITFSLLFLSLSLFLFRAIKEERKLRIMFIFFSYLVTLSFLLTVILCWPWAS